MHGKSHKKDMKSKWKKYKEGKKTENIGKRTHNTVTTVPMQYKPKKKVKTVGNGTSRGGTNYH